MNDDSIRKRNFWVHATEGALYISAGVLLSPQTVFPALVAKLGGSNVAIGSIPIVVYLVMYLPQILSANYVRSIPYRKEWTLRFGLLQRTLILLLAIVVAIFGLQTPTLALFAFFAIYVANQALAGLGSPIWFDLVAKTTVPEDRGKLMGIRISAGAMLGILNSFLLTALLAYLPYPYNFASVFALAFLLQFASWLVQRNVVEVDVSVVESPIAIRRLLGRVRIIIQSDALFRRFLQSAAFLIVGLMPMGFFTIAALKRFHLPESYVGFFTITLVVSQILSGYSLGWLADKKGHKVSLLVCACATACATLVALVARSADLFFVVFFFAGINLGAEMITRYNFVERCAPSTERALYVGIMNGWLAPFYFSATLGGWLSESLGYTSVFALGLISTFVGIIILSRLPDPGRVRMNSESDRPIRAHEIKN